MITSESLAEFIQGLSIEELPPEVIDVSERLLIDSVGCCLGALDAPPVELLRSMYRDYPVRGSAATVLGHGDRLPVEHAALVNGAMVRYLDFNDDYQGPNGGCHPSDLIPTLLAVAEAEGASGEELVEAMTVGYEVLCSGVETGAVRGGGWDYVAWGVQGATAGVGKLMGLSTEQLVSALGIAVASGPALGVTRLGEVSMWKGAAQAFGCHNAVQACQMARAGMSGPRAVYEGQNGFFDLVASEEVTFDALDGPVDDYRITKTNFKPYPACYKTMSAVDATVELFETHALDATDVREITVGTYSESYHSTGTAEKWGSDLTRETADHSMPYVVAIASLEGTVQPESYEPERIQNEDVQRRMNKISVVPDDEMDSFKRDHPQSIPSRLTVHTSDGELEATVKYPAGHWKNPMSDVRIEEKMRLLSQTAVDDERIESIVDTCRDVTSLDSVESLVRETVV